MTVKKIYLWCSPGGIRYGDVIGYAMLEDGRAIASHLSSNEEFSKHDMGYTSRWKHDIYKGYCPEGFQLVWLENPESDEGWKNAFALNQAKKEIS